MAKKQKKMKDLDPKAKAKKVKGGYRRPGEWGGIVVNRSGRAVGKTVEGVGDTINATGSAFNRAMNPR
jgi:hypothetical protein